MRRSRQFGIGKEGGLSTYPGFIKFMFMLMLMEKSANSRARVMGRNGTGKGYYFTVGEKGNT